MKLTPDPLYKVYTPLIELTYWSSAMDCVIVPLMLGSTVKMESLCVGELYYLKCTLLERNMRPDTPNLLLVLGDMSIGAG